MKEIYQVLSGALGQEARLTQVANNLANVNTTGFKKDGSVFLDFYKASIQAQNGGNANGSASSADPTNGSVWPVLGQSYSDFTSGAMQTTGRPLDTAIDGEGFFQVQVEGQPGAYYSRAGNFHLNTQNELVTTNGRRVLDPSGNPIQLDLSKGTPEIAQDGQIRIGGAVVGQLGIFKISDTTKLTKYGEGLFAAPADVQASADTTSQVRQGMLEGSNVNTVDEMVRMIQLERAYQAQQKAMQSIDETAQKRIEAAR